MTDDLTPWTRIDDVDELAERIVDVYRERGNNRYDESVTQTEHAVQSADLALAEGADEPLVIAALLHDLGHLLLDEHDRRADFLDRDLHHEEIAARFLANWFGPEVVEPVRLHVPAKRFLCAVEPDYFAGLSPASVRSLEVQGGPMTSDEATEFAALNGAVPATRLRRWDDLAKERGRPATDIEDFAPIIARNATITVS